MNIKRAIKILTKKLVKDQDYFYGFQSNIAMAFVDEFNRSNKKYKSKDDIHQIANQAAINFLNQLCYDEKISTLKEYQPNEKNKKI